MIKTYEFDYNFGDAHASFEVDTTMFTVDKANDTLTFFRWNYNKKADPIDEVLKKYALQAIWFATKNDHNEVGVTSDFSDYEGYYPVDGSHGIRLISLSNYELDDNLLNMDVKNG